MAGRKSKEQIAAEKAAEDARINAMVEERFKLFADQLQARLQGGDAAPLPSGEAGLSKVLSDLVANMERMMRPADAKRVFSPEELRAMDAGREEMARAIIEADSRRREALARDQKAEAEVWMPHYYLTRKVYIGEQKIEPQYRDPVTKEMKDRHINWPGVPNEAMVPVNEVAKKIHAAFLKSIAGKTPLRNTLSQFVLHGKEVFKGHDRHMEVPVAMPRDSLASVLAPNTAGFSDPQKVKETLRVLGTVAQPVEVR